MQEYYEYFITESNKIEGIYRSPIQSEIDEFTRFMALPLITIHELQQFVQVYQPGAILRDKYGMNVRVGSHFPPLGGPEIRLDLETLLRANLSPWHQHIAYEKLHPFTDGNGRSGRALWAHNMQNLKGGFLKNFYFQTLQNS